MLPIITAQQLSSPNRIMLTSNWSRLSILAKAQRALINEIEFNNVSDINAVHLEVFKEQLNHTVQLFWPHTGNRCRYSKGKGKEAPMEFCSPMHLVFLLIPKLLKALLVSQTLLLLLVPLLLILLLPRKKKGKKYL